jgi:uncharacterized membrane protein
MPRYFEKAFVSSGNNGLMQELRQRCTLKILEIHVSEIKLFGISFISFLLVDLLWIGVIAKKFYTNQMSVIGRIYDGQFQPVLWAALLVYIFLSIGVVFYILPRLEMNASGISSFLTGALLGLIIYGVYDMTNYSTLKDWPLILTLADMFWGAFLCGLITLFVRFIRDFSSN